MSEGYQVEKVLPYKKQEASKREQVKEMFNAISGHYDAMNRTMTMGIDVTWRRRAINSLKRIKPKLILDVATGTGDFAIESFKILQPKKVVGIDISEKMLEIGRLKVSKQGLSKNIQLLQGDCMQLKYEDNSFDAITVAFGIRNFEDLEQGITEMCRVLKSGGNLLIVEASEPFTIFKPFYYFYTKVVMPILALIFRQDVKAYKYLPNSIHVFPKGKKMIAILQSCGFSEVKFRTFTFGVCSFYRAVK